MNTDREKEPVQRGFWSGTGKALAGRRQTRVRFESGRQSFRWLADSRASEVSWS